ncbi:NAD(P)H-binding protein [Natronoglycomyces albus]|uniref:NAD(P)H-binding protein n=1 Tax=Natronoglycomyces albus TaxID=2811108 RepID=A0A895XN20_9ACTN|nr:NAD(P)H-binding protein [Natronoglycomyces albus]QSB05172.1 NAD(P)H-binding protein [Natronoglycomyces albus]
MSSRTAVVAGATGVVGSLVLKGLLARSAWESVHVLSRRPLNFEHPKLTVHEVDFAQLDQQRDLFAVDDVFCCLGTTIDKAGSKEAFRRVDHDYVCNVAEAAANAGARQFLLVSALGADSASRWFYSRVKGEAEETISTLPLPATHIFRPSLLLGAREEKRTGESIAKFLAPLTSPLYVGRLAKYRPVQAAAVAKRMIDVAKEDKKGTHVHYFD